MKNKLHGFGMLLLFLIFGLNMHAQTYDCATINDQYRNDKDVWIIQDVDHPFSSAQIADFEGLFYYPADCDFVMNATLSSPPALKVVNVSTTDGRKVKLYDYGTVKVEIDGKTYNLQAYKNIDLPEFQTNPETVFIPIKDKTSGNTTFAHGRYLFIQPPQSGDKFKIDLNMSINPFENYNSNYSTVVVPASNTIQAPVPVGERKYEDR